MNLAVSTGLPEAKILCYVPKNTKTESLASGGAKSRACGLVTSSLLEPDLGGVVLAAGLFGDYNVSTRCLVSMRVALVRIGNSRGIRIPKPVLRQCGFQDSVELCVENDRLVIAKDHPPRQGWEELFRAAGPAANDELLLDTLPPNQFDQEEWRW